MIFSSFLVQDRIHSSPDRRAAMGAGPQRFPDDYSAAWNGEAHAAHELLEQGEAFALQKQLDLVLQGLL